MKSSARAGDIVDSRYEIVNLIGRGAMADVFHARDRKNDREVALKVLRQAVARDQEAVQRFQREARVQEMLSHRNVAVLYGGGVTKRGEPYLVVELLRGRSLRTVLHKEKRVDLRRATSYTWQALKGLGAVHTLGVHHRDLKPANIMLEPSEGPVERVVLIDFGFASLEGGIKLTAAGHVVGSLSYLAPERLRGEKGDERADLYAMGVILYELLVGTPPFMADDDFELINMHLDAPAESMRVRAPDAGIPKALDDVVLKALSKYPAQRANSATEMADELERAVHG